MNLLTTKILISAFLVVCLQTTQFAQIPSQGMVVHGEILVNGKNASEINVLEARIGAFTVGKAFISNQFGFSNYVLEIDQPPWVSRNTEIVLYLDDQPLQDGKFDWMRGASINQDLLIDSTIQFRPKITKAVAVKDENTLKLDCEFEALQQENLAAEAVTYRIRWYHTIEKDIGFDEKPKLIKESIVSFKETKSEFNVNLQSIPGLTPFLQLIITPVLNSGEVGPSIVKTIEAESPEVQF